MNTRPNAGNAEWRALGKQEPEAKAESYAKLQRDIARLEAGIRRKDAEIAEIDRNLHAERAANNRLSRNLDVMEASRNRVAARNRQFIDALRAARVPIPGADQPPPTPSGARITRPAITCHPDVM